MVIHLLQLSIDSIYMRTIGIDGYQFGNDLQYIALQCPSALERAKALGYPIHNDTITGPDNYKYKILPSIANRAELFVCVALGVSSLARTREYWSDLLGMQQQPTPLPLQTDRPSSLLAFSSAEAGLQFIEVCLY
jgi:hypothetical protein